MSDKRVILNPLRLLAKITPKILKASPKLVIYCSLAGILLGVFAAINTPIKQKLFDSATTFASHASSSSSLIFWLVVIAINAALFQVFNGVANFLPIVLDKKLRGILSYEVNIKTCKLNPIDFENTQRLDEMNKVSKGIEASVDLFEQMAVSFLVYFLYFAIMGVYLYSLRPLLLIILLIAFVPIFITQIVRSKIFSKLEDKLTPIHRENEYYERTVDDRIYFKETRLLGGFTYFYKLFKSTLINFNNLTFAVNVKNNLVELILRGLTAACYAAIIYILFQSVIASIISLGAFAAVFASVGEIFMLMEDVMFNHVKRLSEKVGTIHFYLDFLDLPERDGEDMDISPTADIELKNASFTYPNSETPALKNINFTLKHGETIAVVGENGSGKSTLTRLITGLYTPTEGEVLIDGMPMSEISMKSLFKNTTETFQKYQRYQMTLKDNLEISDMAEPSDTKKLDKITAEGGVNVIGENFSDGYDTMLSREFDGVDLSGGQWQRVAIARGFYREHNLIILDEPTAAIDPFEEAKIYNNFAQSAKGKTAVIVTHRLGSVKLADRIAVMLAGELVEVGVHDELLAKNGEYKRLWQAQEQWYR